MYRQYENPCKLAKWLADAEEAYQIAIEENADEQTIMDLQMEIAELKDRINFAWQDDEYDGYDEY